MGKKRSKTMEHAHFMGCGLGEARQVSKVSLETWQKEKRDPNDADDAGQGASIITIIGGPFLHVWPPMHPMTPH